MQIDMFDLADFIEANHCQEVTSPVALNPDGSPNDSGIFSERIFGVTSYDQKNMFGYVDLHCHVIHPAVYNLIKSRIKKVYKIITGDSWAVVANGRIEIVDETFKDAGTGIDWLYDNFKKIQWMNETEEADEDGSIDKKTRLTFFKVLGIDEFFVDKWLVLPRFYRDYADEDDLGDEINKVYKELLIKTSSLKSQFSFAEFSDAVQQRIQDLVYILYMMTMKPVSGKTVTLPKSGVISSSSIEKHGTGKFSMFKKHALGKNIDYSALSVIVVSVPSKYEVYEDMETRYGHTLVPLQSLVAMFKPFFVRYCSDWLQYMFDNYRFAHPEVEFDDSQFVPSRVDGLLDKFIKSEASKDEIISFELKDDKGIPSPHHATLFECSDPKGNLLSEQIERPATLLDIVFMAAMDICKDKCCLTTRYPIADHQNLYLSEISVASTLKTRVASISIGSPFRPNPHAIVRYDKYPYIKLPESAEQKPDEYYRLKRELSMSEYMIAQMGADFDGDTVMTRGLFTNEANAEARKLIHSKSNFFDATGKLSRGLTKIKKESIVSLYEITKGPDE